ncbi:hypothetical protein H310_08692 [Aphanomyces invadans]|uniref:Uncharacterized protein n=1 Tax=Aphanomyces invadans TaxID=157072 RepID=A0A024TX21_9STRA|nr:hypothetical protein H310_08692 [Aphanomyces invadans]ETV98568.1 hypothetical protein H310_08692 [Aphanomyces invadans]|eukprot:XP_008872765.1 hypothetical protein H310_08692 [Aphanomyces invadans]
MICTQRLPASASYGLVVIGGEGLRRGCQELASHAHVVLPKVLKVADSSAASMPAILHRLVRVGKQLGALLAYRDPLDLSI